MRNGTTNGINSTETDDRTDNENDTTNRIHNEKMALK